MKSKRRLTDLRDLLWDHLIPNMRLLFMMHAPEKYYKWQGNCCRQAAMMTYMAGHYWLGVHKHDIHLTELSSTVKIKSSGMASALQHAFINMCLDDTLRAVSVDMSLRQPKPIFDLYHPFDPARYPWLLNTIVTCLHAEDSPIRIFCPEVLEKEPEYYTGLNMKQIYDFCLNSKPLTKEILDELRKPDHFRRMS